MCSIGSVFTSNGVYVYKQCDLTTTKQFYEPEVRPGRSPYIAMTREGRPGIWAGLNARGVSFVAADAYTNRTYDTPDDAVNALFGAYEASVAQSSSAAEAAKILESFYRSGYRQALFPGPDIALFADASQAIFIEYTPGPSNHDPVRRVVVNKNFFASTNHFRVQPDAVAYDANHSTYLRLARAETILEKDPSHDGIMSLLVDQYYGPSELSICRKQEYAGEYFTQATVLFGSDLSCEYQINGNPIDHQLRPFRSEKWAMEGSLA
jgi:hypothetical protein